MAQKYEIYHETGWDDHSNRPVYERLTTLKNEQAAINFISDVGNVGKYGNMFAQTKQQGYVMKYNEQEECWDVV